jgi:hypothetical protein
MLPLFRDFIRFEHILRQHNIKALACTAKISYTSLDKARSEDDLIQEVKYRVAKNLLNLYAETQQLADWQVTYEEEALHFNAQTFILNRRKLNDLLTTAYLEGAQTKPNPTLLESTCFPQK